MKYYDLTDRVFHETQNEDNSRLEYDNEYFDGIYERARNREKILVSDLQVPEFIMPDILQKSLFMAYYIYLKNNNGDESEIATMEEILFPQPAENMAEEEE